MSIAALSDQTPFVEDRIDFTRYIVVPVWYYCNSKCTFCMVERQLGSLPTVDFEKFKKIVINVINEGKYDCLILSGGEVTTFERLPEYVEYAASFGWFRKIQIQSNGRRLANRDYVRRLVDAGLNEFFISMHGLEEVHDAVTCAKGGYKETIKGIENLADAGVKILSNTVLTTQNLHGLVPLMTYLRDLPVREMQIWNYFPMASSDRKNLLVRMEDFLQVLPELLETVRPSGKPLVLKSFPECFGRLVNATFDNNFPLNLIHDDFWDNFGENAFGQCIYKDACSRKTCWGLANAYVEKFGDGSGLLAPI